jgi:hypothetical protein
MRNLRRLVIHKFLKPMWLTFIGWLVLERQCFAKSCGMNCLGRMKGGHAMLN